MFKGSPICFVLQHSPIHNTVEFMSLLKVRSHNVHSMLPVNLNELLLCFLSDCYNIVLEKGPFPLKRMYYDGVQNQAITCPGRSVQCTSLQKCDLVPLEVRWSDDFLPGSGCRPVTARLFVRLPVLPASIQERNASLLVGLQCFDVRFQMEPEAPRHVGRTKPNFYNVQERCLRIIKACSYMLATVFVTAL